MRIWLVPLQSVCFPNMALDKIVQSSYTVPSSSYLMYWTTHHYPEIMSTEDDYFHWVKCLLRLWTMAFIYQQFIQLLFLNYWQSWTLDKSWWTMMDVVYGVVLHLSVSYIAFTVCFFITELRLNFKQIQVHILTVAIKIILFCLSITVAACTHFFSLKTLNCFF